MRSVRVRREDREMSDREGKEEREEGWIGREEYSGEILIIQGKRGVVKKWKREKGET